MARLVIKSGESAPGVIELKPGLNRLGRSQGNDHLLNHPAISDQHCEITVEKDFVLVKDLGSTNGTFINCEQIQQSALLSGQTLQMGPFEMELDMPVAHLAIPDLPQLANPFELPVASMLADGYAACLGHDTRHAVWDCTRCGRHYCDECVRKLRRVGGAYLRFCAACSSQCRLSDWSRMMKRKKRSLLAAIADTVKTGFKRTKLMLGGGKSSPPRRERRPTGNG